MRFLVPTDQSEATMKEEDGDESMLNGDWDVRSFFLKPPASAEELEQLAPDMETRLGGVVEQMEQENCCRIYQECQKKILRDVEQTSDLVEDVDVDCTQIDPRSYQLALLERAKHENTIVHLGTGTG
jgi:hypothetical protein